MNTRISERRSALRRTVVLLLLWSGAQLMVVPLTFLAEHVTAIAAEIDPVVYDRLLSEAIPVWQQMEKAWLADLSGRLTTRYLTVYLAPSGRWETLDVTSIRTFCFAGDFRLVREGREGSDERTRVVLTNPRYTAVVRRRGPDLPYSLEQAALKEPGKEFELRREELAVLPICGFRLFGIPLYELLKGNRKGVKLTRLVEERHADGATVRLQFEEDFLFADRGLRTEATAELDPQNFWLLRKVVEKRSDGIVATVDYEYWPAQKGFPFPKSVRYVTRNTAPGREKAYDETAYMYDPPGPARCAKEEYYLEYYGIPESALLSRSPRRWPVMLLYWGGIIGVVIASAAILWYSHRRRRKEARAELSE
ncbi:MAG: hypothetical protein KatS3mg110_2938 [Pirellulaceae bacterium]|nr:MAG: hypothetical protein KatS3mg110_2938 [Pirellulaceae bacterium]